MEMEIKDKTKTKIEVNGRCFEISAGKGQAVEKWGAWRNRFRIYVKDSQKDNAWTYFNFYDSVMHFEEGREYLTEEDLKFAFRCFLEDALAGLLDFEDFLAEFGYDEREGKRIWKDCQKQFEKAKKLGFENEEDLADALNELTEKRVC